MSAADLDYDTDTAAAMLAALKLCPAKRRLDTLAVVVRIAVEDRYEPWFESLATKETDR